MVSLTHCLRRVIWFPILVQLAAACGGGGGGSSSSVDAMPPPMPDANQAPDASMLDAGPPDAAIPVMSISEIIAAAASRRLTTQLTVLGVNLADGATMILENCDTSTQYDLTASVVVAADGYSLTAELPADDTREQGLYTVTVTNPDGQSDALACAFSVQASDPPVATDVVQASAYRGISGDARNSDTVVTVSGIGFQSTPNVRWVKTDGTAAFDALFVGYVSDTQVTAIVPSETLSMPVGDYHVYVINPDLLSGQWTVDDGTGTMQPGIFTITDVPPPDIADVSPARVPGAVCLTEVMTITGSGFAADSTAWWVAPPDATCASSDRDSNGNVLCPLNVTYVDPNTLEATFAVCPALGAWPIMVRNSDNQADTFFNVEVRNNNSGHLDSSAFTIEPARLNTARFKHASNFGFDPFGSAYIYVAGGQDASGSVLGTVEITQLNIFGKLSPFRISQQYLGPQNPRALNTPLTPRQGATLARVGRTLFMMGGASTATDVVDTVPAMASVERARILSFDEMPAVRRPTAMGGGGLPVGSWYYQVAAVGPWGESLPTREVVALNSGGQIELCWNAPAAPGATGYTIYRSLAADGRAQSTAAMAFEVPGPCFVDTGTGALTPAPGSVRGTLSTGGALSEGEHLYRVSATIMIEGQPLETYAGYPASVALNAADVAAGYGSIQLRWNAIEGATYSVYKRNAAAEGFQLLIAGLTEATFLDEGAPFADPPVAPRAQLKPLAPGSLSLWTDDVPAMNTAREGADSVVIELDPDMSMGVAARILVAGGRTENTAGSYLRSAESLGIMDDGTLDPVWTMETPQFTYARAFYSLLTTQGRNETPFPPAPEEPPCGDLDGDGYVSCDCAPTGATEVDCNDADPSVHPGAMEICGDGIDQDCDMGCTGVDLECACTDDLDGDTHVSTTCGGDDCCDMGTEGTLGCSATTAPGIHGGALEICGNGIDEDCDGVDAVCGCEDDLDMDGHVSIACGGGDCCDVGTDTSLGCTASTADTIYPGAPEVCGDGVDQDCDGMDQFLCLAPSSQPQPAQLHGKQRPATSSASLTMSLAAPTTLDSTQELQHQPVQTLLSGDEPVYLVAVLGDDELTATNSGRTDLEACRVDDITGHLACAQWAVQSSTTSQASFAMDALLYFGYLYPFYGLSNENVSTGTRSLISAAIARFVLNEPADVGGDQVIAGRQSANVSPEFPRAYYSALRLMSYIYLIGGYTDTGPTDTIERHLQ